MATFESLLLSVGAGGGFYTFIVSLMFCPLLFFSAWIYSSYIFASSVPDHWCRVPGRYDFNISLENWKNLTLPSEISPDGRERYSSCFMYNNSGIVSSQQLINAAGTFPKIECQNGWEYDETNWKRTVVTDFDWVCDNNHYPTLIYSCNIMVGTLGTLLVGASGDWLGRKRTVFFSLAMMVIGIVIIPFAPNFEVFFACQLIINFPVHAFYSLLFILLVEMTAQHHRERLNGLLFNTWTGAFCILPLLAWLAADWVIMMHCIAWPSCLMLLAWWITPESPRWLLSKGRVKEAADVCRYIAGKSQWSVPEDLNEQLENLADNTKMESTENCFLFFKHMKTVLLLLELTVCGTAGYMLYGVLAINIGNMGGNEFINFFLLSVIEFPANLIGWWLCNRVGRRWVHSGGFFFGGLIFFSMLSTIGRPDLVWVETGLAAAAKFVISISFFAFYLQMTELFPTTLRASGNALVIVLANSLSTAGPYIIYLGKTSLYLPYIILGVLAITGAVTASFLPDTIGYPLPETFQEMLSFGCDQTYFSVYRRQQSEDAKDQRELRDMVT